MSTSGFLSILLCLIAVSQGARDGGWSPWSNWSECPVTCGSAFQFRFRLCNNPPPSRGGMFCQGQARDSKQCDDLMPCPVDGGWTTWSFWSDCSKTCGRGVRRRFRTCTEPEPQEGGRPCDGVPEQRKTCTVNLNCPRDGEWSMWSGWSPCSVTCGEGTRQRFRACNNPPPTDGGRPCRGLADEIDNCDAAIECPVNGQWSGWSEWSPCPVTCGTAEIRRFRECNSPPPMFGGLDCTGIPTETELCEPGIPCPVHGQWSQWSVWGPCLSTNCITKNDSLTYRQRSCNNPLPAHNGIMCKGNFVTASICRTPINCPVDGKWSEWSDWICSDEVAKRTRECDSPPPANGGKPCPAGPNIEFYSKNEHEDMFRKLCGGPPVEDYEEYE